MKGGPFIHWPVTIAKSPVALKPARSAPTVNGIKTVSWFTIRINASAVKNCVRSCPFGAPVFNPEKQKAEKCSLCYQRIDAGLAPACTQACPTEAIQIAALSSQNDAGLVQYPPGFPAAKRLNPSTRFYNPRQPEVIRRKKLMSHLELPLVFFTVLSQAAIGLVVLNALLRLPPCSRDLARNEFSVNAKPP